MPLCNYTKVLTNNDIYRHGEITGTAMLINRTNFVIIDIDNKGKTIEERKAIFDNLCKTFLPSPDTNIKYDQLLLKYLYAEQTISYGLHIVLSAIRDDRLDTVFVKDEYKDEVATTTDEDRALSSAIVHDALVQRNRFCDIYDGNGFAIDIFTPFARTKDCFCLITQPNVYKGYKYHRRMFNNKT